MSLPTAIRGLLDHATADMLQCILSFIGRLAGTIRIGVEPGDGELRIGVWSD